MPTVVLAGLIEWGLTALSAQIRYIVPSQRMLQLKSQIYEKVDNVTTSCVGSTYKTNTINNSFNLVFVGKTFDTKEITIVSLPSQLLG